MSDNAVENLPSIEESAQKLAKRVKLSFADLMTDEQMKDLVKSAIARFTDRKDPYNSHRERESELDKMIKDEMLVHLKPLVHEEVGKQIKEVTISNDALKDFVKEMAPAIITQLLRNIIEASVDGVRNQLLQDFQNMRNYQ